MSPDIAVGKLENQSEVIDPRSYVEGKAGKRESRTARRRAKQVAATFRMRFEMDEKKREFI